MLAGLQAALFYTREHVYLKVKWRKQWCYYLSNTKAKEQEKYPTEETESMLAKEEGIKITLLKTVKRKKMLQIMQSFRWWWISKQAMILCLCLIYVVVCAAALQANWSVTSCMVINKSSSNSDANSVYNRLLCLIQWIYSMSFHYHRGCVFGSVCLQTW